MLPHILRVAGCDTGVVSGPECRGIGGNQATFDNSQRNNLRSLCAGSVVVLVRMFVLISLLV